MSSEDPASCEQLVKEALRWVDNIRTTDAVRSDLGIVSDPIRSDYVSKVTAI